MNWWCDYLFKEQLSWVINVNPGYGVLMIPLRGRNNKYNLPSVHTINCNKGHCANNWNQAIVDKIVQQW